MKKEFKIDFSRKAKKDLEKFRKKYWKSYSDFLSLVPVLSLDPYGVGEPLKGNLKGLYALHFGRKPECRALYKIESEMVLVLVLKIGTRENFYNIF